MLDGHDVVLEDYKPLLGHYEAQFSARVPCRKTDGYRVEMKFSIWELMIPDIEGGGNASESSVLVLRGHFGIKKANVLCMGDG